MNLSDFSRMPKEELKDYLRSHNVEFIEEATKEDLVAIARQAFVKGMNEAEKAATDKVEANAKVSGGGAPAPKEQEETEDEKVLSAIDEMRKMGFETKQQAISYLDGITRERKMLEFRTTEFADRERICAEREAKADARDKYLDDKGVIVLKQVMELKELTEKNQDQIGKLSRLNTAS